MFTGVLKEFERIEMQSINYIKYTFQLLELEFTDCCKTERETLEEGPFENIKEIVLK